VQNFFISFISNSFWDDSFSKRDGNSQPGIAFGGLRYIQCDIHQVSSFQILASAVFLSAFLPPGPFYYPCTVADQTQ